MISRSDEKVGEMMANTHAKTWFSPAFGLLFLAILSACGSPDQNSGTVAVNLSLVMDSQQAQNHLAASRIMAFLQRWIPGAASAQAQSVNDIRTIQVQISGPDIPVPPTTSVPVSDPTSGQEIPVTIQAPVGPNRTITVAALNVAGQKIFGGTLPNVTLAPGPPIALVITLKPVFTVTVNKQGNGGGTVTSTPSGITCDASCSTQSAQFDADTPVALNAAASPGSSFAGWSGGCSGTAACTVTGNATVTARFITAVSTNHLTVIKAGAGTGTVSSDPSGISCGTACSADFLTGSPVSLTATPTGGSTFAGWSGGGWSGAVPSCIVVIIGDQTVTASFTAPVSMSTLTVQKSGAGSGTVTSAPSGINCGITCSASFPTGNTVTLTASPAAGSTFVSWSGACSGTTCTVTMSADQTVSAQFDLLPVFVTLTINKSGNGDGTVTDNTGAIVCGTACQATYLQGTVVTLTATANEGSIFDEWQGGPCNNQTGQCTLTMDMDRTAEANFDPNN